MPAFQQRHVLRASDTENEEEQEKRAKHIGRAGKGGEGKTEERASEREREREGELRTPVTLVLRVLRLMTSSMHQRGWPREPLKDP